MKKRVWLKNEGIEAGFCMDRGAMVTLKSPLDANHTEYLLSPEEFPEFETEDAGWLGNLHITVEKDNKIDIMHTAASNDIRTCTFDKDHFCVKYRGNSECENGIRFLEINEEFEMQAEGLLWKIRIKNTENQPLIIQRLGISLPMNQYFRGDDNFKYEQCVMRHSCIVGTHSWIYWSKSSGQMPVLLMQTLANTGLYHFERCTDPKSPQKCFGSIGKAFEGMYQVFPYHMKTDLSHLKCCEKRLASEEEIELKFLFSMEQKMTDLNKKLYLAGGVGVEVSPGMCVPKGQPVKLKLFSSKQLDILTKSREDQIVRIANSGSEYEVEIIFGEYGIRQIEIRDNDGIMYLSFFCIEDPEKIIDKQANFIAEKQFETNENDPCYHGLLMWDMTVKSRINSSCNPHGSNWFAGGSDEIGLVSGVFLSEKNVYRPVEKELYVLEQYLEDFVEQRLTEQPGDRVHRMVPWYQMFDDWKGRGADDVWRAFNYVHVINTYYNMYRIRSIYEFGFLKSARFYLKRAYDYTKAMFSYWMFPDGVGATHYANMGEMTIPLYLEQALDKEGYLKEAQEIHRLVMKKCAYFGSKEYPFGSEMAYDSTAFEAVFTYGKRMQDEKVMKGAAMAVFANRGGQPVWYLHRTDLRQMGDSSWNVSYMTQLGAYALYDWTLNQNHKDVEMIKAFYASYLSGFSIYNSGGWWSEDVENDGASAWIVVGEKGQMSGSDSDGQLYLKGCVPMSGESALGYFGALKIASSVVLLDEDGDTLSLGCKIRMSKEMMIAEPEDGLGIRWFDLIHDWAVKLQRDRIKKLVWTQEKYQIFIENYTGDKHMISMEIRAPKSGKYNIKNGNYLQEVFLTTEWVSVNVELFEDNNIIEICPA